MALSFAIHVGLCRAGEFKTAEKTTLRFDDPWRISRENALKVLGCKAAGEISSPDITGAVKHTVGCDPNKVIPVVRDVRDVLLKDVQEATVSAGGMCGQAFLFYPGDANKSYTEHMLRIDYIRGPE